MTEKQERFIDFCRRNRDLRVERDADGSVIIMSPTFSKTGIYSGRLFRQLDEYCEHTGNGYAFDSSSGFTLRNGAKRSPDASWIASDRWEALTDAQQDSFAPVAPARVSAGFSYLWTRAEHILAACVHHMPAP